MLLYMFEVSLAGDKIGNHPNHPEHAAIQGPSGLGGGAAAPWAGPFGTSLL